MNRKLKKRLIGLLLIVLASTVLFFLFIVLSDYKPDLIEAVEVLGTGDKKLSQGESIQMTTWNIGYAALGEGEEFFMDGGGNRRPTEKKVEKYLKGILETIRALDTDITMLQEVDVYSKRSFYINELERIASIKNNEAYSFAKTYDVKFVPVPLPPIGRVTSGLATFSEYSIKESKRYAFEGNYPWPKSTVLLDRCFMISRVSLEGTKKELLLINAHFSAYDDGSLRASQLAAIKNYMIDAYNEGNYVIIGADWNQTFEFINTEAFPIYEEGKFFLPSIITNDWLEEGWQWAIDPSTPTYRLLNASYIKGETQVGIIDGFLVSPNVQVENVKTLDLNFENSDHNPVKATFKLKE